MQSTFVARASAGKLRHWLGDALFTGRSASDYFAAFYQAIDPDWMPGRATATVESIHVETADTKTLVLRPSPGWSGFVAGQHVALTVDINGRHMTRTFTIATAPDEFAAIGTIGLTIKRNAAGTVTPWLHGIRPGVRVGLSAAQGDFVLPSLREANLVYLAAGAGITPVMSHLRALAAQSLAVPVTLLYYVRQAEECIFLDELQTLAQQSKCFRLFIITTRESGENSRISGRICAAHLQDALAGLFPSQIYVCGPGGFAEASLALLKESAAAGVAVVSEHFGGVVSRAEGDQRHDVLLRSSRRTLAGNNAQTLLETAEQNGLQPQAGCRMGICHTCKCKKTAGQVRNLLTGEISDAGEEMIQLCISVPETAITLDL